ncbi:terminase large subunit domain-containing protein [Chromohalobacter israelensis]|uniref:terminase large subunit domain-containing protein n=1 Tax=Chromohalobacter israelensis TaxID=141390 RepID=UPI00265BEC1F|nr:terminase family protein [Chromohalobacter salexigens]MDO0944646.1 terminase family protein [Chromohalobacter salexigens]
MTRDPLNAGVQSGNAILLGYQQRWVADDSAVKVIEKSRRIGLSYAEAADDVLYAASEAGANVYYISYNQEMTQGFIQDCAGWAKAYQAAAGQIEESVIEADDKQILTYTIKFDSGHMIKAFTSNPRNLRSKGRPGERLVIDEAAFVDDIEELLKAAMAMTIWGGQIRIISTHNGEDNPFNTLINDIRADRYDYSLHRVDLDEALGEGLYRRICQVTGRTWSRVGEAEWRQQLINRYKPNEDEELFCIPALGGGAYLTRTMIEACMAPLPVLRFNGTREFNALPEPQRAAIVEDWIREALQPLLAKLDPRRRHALGQDFARSGDLSVIAPMEIGEPLHRTVPFLVEMHNVPFKQQEQILFAVGNGLPRLSGVAIDSRGNGSYIGEAARDEWGSIVDQVQATENWYRERMPRYKARFEDATITIPQHDGVLEDHRAFKLVRGVARLPEGKTDGKGERHGDAAMACVLADSASDMDHVEIDFIPVPKGGTQDTDDADDGGFAIGDGAW